MDYSKLEKGKKIADAIKDKKRQKTYFSSRIERNDTDYIDSLVNFFKNCQNLSGLSEKKALAEFCFKQIDTALKTEIEQLEKEFDEL